MTARQLLSGYRWLYCALLILASVQTLAAGGAVAHVVPLAGAEILGALLLLWRGTHWPGLVLLLLVFALAQGLAAAGGAWHTRFLQYAASALFIVLMERALTRAPGSTQ